MNTLPQVSPIPQPPTTTDIDNFNVRADAFLAALPLFQQQLNSVIAALNPLVPELPGLDRIVQNLEAIRVTGENIAQVNATGTNMVSVNAVAVPAKSGALQKLADATAAMRALAPVAVELGELATHLAELTQLSDKTAQLLAAVAEIESIMAAAANIAELVALGANMDAVLGVYANLAQIQAAIQAAVTVSADAKAAQEARKAAEDARDRAQGFADSASGITGLPLGSENNAPLVWNEAAKRWVPGTRPALATPEMPGLAAGDESTITTARGTLSLSKPVSIAADPDTLVLRDAEGKMTGDVTGSATPRAHAASHSLGSVDAISLAMLGYTASIPGAPDTLVKRNSQGKIEGQMATPQPPSTHAASHAQDGTDPVSLEGLGVTISVAPPSGTAARLWIQYF